MASQALPAGTPIRRRRVAMGLFDADGWAWAGVKSAFWFVLIILMLGYLPDRAYYLTVNKTLDLGLLAWSPINFCPAENKTLPCPAPVGAVIPWESSPAELALPAPRTGAGAAQLGTHLLVVGGSDGTGPTDTTFVAEVADGNFGQWTQGPALPEARSGAGLVLIGSSAFLVGGTGPDGNPTDTIWSLTADPDTNELGEWTPVENVVLPEPRTGAAILSVSDGLIVAGGIGTDGSISNKVWKANLDAQGVPGGFEEQAPLTVAVADASIAQVGDFIWLYGGRDANGPVGAVQRGSLGEPPATETPAPNATPIPTELLQWAVSDSANLPGARTMTAGFTANGSLYVVGGADAAGARSEVYWTVPGGDGSLPGWKHLDQTDLAAPIVGGAAVPIGTNVVVIGGTGPDGVLATSTRANLAPAEPFFQAGLVGVVVPALRIEGEIGQQLGYLNAAGVATVDFVILLLIGWAFAHKETVRGWVDRRRSRRRDRAST